MIATAVLLLPGLLPGAPVPATTITCLGEEIPARLVFGDTFETMEHWANLTPRTRWHVEDGALIGHWAPGGSTIWSRPAFSGDLYLRFRARLLEPEDEWRTEQMPDGGINLNFRFLVSGPGGADIREVYRDLAARGTGSNRIGDDRYQGYFFTWTWRHARLRRSPGHVNLGERRDVLPRIGEDYTIEVLKQGGRIRYAVDGQVLHDYHDDRPFDSGRVGFTLWRSRVAVDFIEVYELVGP
ncbi:MAG: hypothetical protein ACOC7J_05805 [Armatimonadota bacterium]